MNHDLESLLRALPLRQPSEALDARIGRLGLSWRRKLKVTIGLGALAAAAAIALAIVLAKGSPSPAPSAELEIAQPQPAPVAPPRLEQSWSLVDYVGAVPRADGAPLRVFRQQTVRTVRWLDEQGATLEITVPQEEIILLAAQTY